MSRANQFFESTLEKVARIMARQYGLTVVIRGNVAMTDGKTIYLPMLEDVSDELSADLFGLLDHEVAHCKFTDFDAMRGLINRFHKELFNAIEDSRIELLLPLEYPGTALTLERLNQKWGAKLENSRKDMPWPIRLILCLREIYDGRTPVIDKQIEPLVASVLNETKALRKATTSKQVIDGTADIIKKVNLAREELAKGLTIADDDDFDELDAMRGGETSVELDPNRKDKEGKQAQGMEQFDPATEQKDSKDSEKGDSEEADSGEGEEGEGEGKPDKASVSAEQKGKQKGNGDESESEGDEDADENGSKSKTGKTDKSDTEKQSDNNVNPDDETDSIEGGKDAKNSPSDKWETRRDYATWKDTPKENQMLSDGLESESEFDNHEFSTESYMDAQFEKAVSKEPKVHNERGYYSRNGGKIDTKHVSLPYTREFDKVIDFTGKGDRQAFAERKVAIMRHVNPIKQHLERVLKVKENRKMIAEKERGTLNTRTLAQMCIDNNYRTPFKQHTKIDTTNVAVSLVIDCSGSMGGNKIELARQTGLALGESLKALGITFEVVGFNTSGDSSMYNATRGITDEERKRFNRFGEILRHMVFKDFASNDLSGICKAEAGGANADGESITWAAKRLAERKEKRKIMLVLSDGQPSHGGANHEVLAGDLKRVISILPKAGIEPIGIGIGTDDPKLFYPNYVIVNDVSKLATSVVKKLADLLEEGYK